MGLVFLCVKIFFVRILDVSLGTFRTMVVVKGKSFYAALIGFFEILIWFLVVREALSTDSDSIFIALSYAGGFATGTFIGGILSNKFINSELTVQIITTNADEMASILRKKGYAVTVVNTSGIDINTERKMLLININSKKLDIIRDIVRENNKDAFVLVNETKYVFNGFSSYKK